MSYEEHLAPFYGASIAELQFADRHILQRACHANVLQQRSQLSCPGVLAPLHVLLEIVLANHEPTDEV